MSLTSTAKHALAWFGDLIQERPVAVLTLLAVGASGFLLWHQSNVQSEIVQESALNNAQAYSEAFASFRTVYTSEVVETVRRQGTPVTHDYVTREGAILLPATLSMILGEKIGEIGRASCRERV